MTSADSQEHLDFADKNFFVGVGAMKSGTTWLANRLEDHPQIFIRPIKELHWFDEDADGYFYRKIVRRTRKNLTRMNRTGEKPDANTIALMRRVAMQTDEDYVGYFRSFTTGAHRAFGEITPTYAGLGVETYRRMASLHPNIRFLFLMRNPADRFWSQYSHLNRRTEAETDPDLDIDDIGRVAMANLMSNSNYEATLSSLAEVVAGDRIFWTYYEDLFGEKADAVLDAMWDFLGVDRIPTTSEQLEHRVNVTAPTRPSSATRTEIARRLAPTYRWAADLPRELPDSWKKDIADLGL